MQPLTSDTRTIRAVNEHPVARYIAARDALRALSEDDFESEDSAECVLERAEFSVRRVGSDCRRSQASMLIERRYSWRGYETPNGELTRDPHRITLEASNELQLFGTLTLGLDSDTGLLADALYKQEIDAFRGRGRRTCEVSKFAVEPQCGSKEVLGSLFYVAYLYARMIHRCTDAFVEVHPRHAKFYERMLGFRQIGDVLTCPRVGAPAVLLHLEIAYMDAQIASCRGSRDCKDRSLYPYFLPYREQQGAAHRGPRSERGACVLAAAA